MAFEKFVNLTRIFAANLFGAKNVETGFNKVFEQSLRTRIGQINHLLGLIGSNTHFHVASLGLGNIDLPAGALTVRFAKGHHDERLIVQKQMQGQLAEKIYDFSLQNGHIQIVEMAEYYGPLPHAPIAHSDKAIKDAMDAMTFRIGRLSLPPYERDIVLGKLYQTSEEIDLFSMKTRKAACALMSDMHERDTVKPEKIKIYLQALETDHLNHQTSFLKDGPQSAAEIAFEVLNVIFPSDDMEQLLQSNDGLLKDSLYVQSGILALQKPLENELRHDQNAALCRL